METLNGHFDELSCELAPGILSWAAVMLRAVVGVEGWPGHIGP